MYLEDSQNRGEKQESFLSKSLNLQFHQCVNLDSSEDPSRISFIPPDGQFELMKYSLRDWFKPLFQVQVDIIRKTETFEETQLQICSAFGPKTVANDVEVSVPVPSDCMEVSSDPQSGVSEYLPSRNRILWRVFSVKGQEKSTLIFRYKLPTIKSCGLKRRQISVPSRGHPDELQHQLPFYERAEDQNNENKGPVWVRVPPMGEVHN